MCLAVPMKIKSRDGDYAVVEFGGIRRRVNICLIEEAEPGDYLIVHAGFAIEKLDVEEANRTLVLIESLKNEKKRKNR